MKQRILSIENVTDLEILRSKSLEVTNITPEVQKLTEDLLDTLRGGDDSNRIGVGLAAPQIGAKLRVIVLEYAGEVNKNGETINKIPTTVLINPKIEKFSKEKTIIDEGCLSVPGVYGPVERPTKIRLTAISPAGKKQNISASGYFARVLQHEIDHLDGILYTDHVAKDKLYRKVEGDENDINAE